MFKILSVCIIILPILIDSKKSCSELIQYEYRDDETLGYLKLYVPPATTDIEVEVNILDTRINKKKRLTILQNRNGVWKALKYGGYLRFLLNLDPKYPDINSIRFNDKILCQHFNTDSQLWKYESKLMKKFSKHQLEKRKLRMKRAGDN